MDGLIKTILKSPKIKMRLIVKWYKGIRLEGQRNEKNREKNPNKEKQRVLQRTNEMKKNYTDRERERAVERTTGQIY